MLPCSMSPEWGTGTGVVSGILSSDPLSVTTARAAAANGGGGSGPGKAGGVQGGLGRARRPGRPDAFA
jgi:hypothetical protein